MPPSERTKSKDLSRSWIFSRLDQYLHLAQQAALESGLYIESHRYQPVEIRLKSTGDSLAAQVVTEVDIHSQEIILQHLKTTLSQDDLAFLAEETPDNRQRFHKKAFWCIDPLDGTLPFTEGIEGYSVSIGLVSQTGKPYLGVIYNPRQQTLYSAIQRQPAYRNQKLWNPPHPSSYFTWVQDRSMQQHKHYAALMHAMKVWAQNQGKQLKIIAQGGAAINACWVMENHPACYFKIPKPEAGGGSLWDFAASACIITQAGGSVTDFWGNPLHLNNSHSTYMNQQGVLIASSPQLSQEIQTLLSFLDT